MNAMIPTPDVLQVAPIWFHVLLLATFPIHLLFMNAMIGTGAIALHGQLRGDDTHRDLAHELARILPILIAFTVNTAVPPLLFLQVIYGNFLYTSSILIAAFWLSVPFLVMSLYCIAYYYDFKVAGHPGRLGAGLVFLVLLLAFAVGFILTNNMTLMLDPLRWSSYFNARNGVSLNTSDFSILPRYLHLMSAGLGMGGLFVALCAKYRLGHKVQVQTLGIRLGMRLFTILTAAQLALGSWYFMKLPRPVMLLFMGQSLPATILFGLTMILTVALIIFGWKQRLGLATGHAMALFIVMVLVRDIVRTGYLQPFFQLDSLKVVPQYSPLVLFLITLALGIAVIWWMLKQVAKAKN